MALSSSAPWLNFYGKMPKTLDYPRLTIYQMIEQTGTKYPDLIAYEFMNRPTSYADFLARIDRTASNTQAPST